MACRMSSLSYYCFWVCGMLLEHVTLATLPRQRNSHSPTSQLTMLLLRLCPFYLSPTTRMFHNRLFIIRTTPPRPLLHDTTILSILHDTIGETLQLNKIAKSLNINSCCVSLSDVCLVRHTNIQIRSYIWILHFVTRRIVYKTRIRKTIYI